MMAYAKQSSTKTTIKWDKNFSFKKLKKLNLRGLLKKYGKK